MGRLMGDPCPSPCSGLQHEGCPCPPPAPGLAPTVGEHWALQMSGEPGGGVSGCRGESREPKPLSSGAVMVGGLSHVPPGGLFGPGHKEGGIALWPQYSFPGKTLARAASQLHPQGPRVRVGSLEETRPPSRLGHSPGKGTVSKCRSAQSAQG